MEEVSGQGRTVLFVSHQMSMINSLCQRAILLSSGMTAADGPAEQVIKQYLSSDTNDNRRVIYVEFPEDIKSKGQILDIRIMPKEAKWGHKVDVFDQLLVTVRYQIRDVMQGVAVALIVKRNHDIVFVTFDTDTQPELLSQRLPGEYVASVTLPSPLKAGKYKIDVSLSVLNHEGVDVRRDALVFDVDELSYDSSMRSYSLSRPGLIAADLKWETAQIIGK